MVHCYTAEKNPKNLYPSILHSTTITSEFGAGTRIFLTYPTNCPTNWTLNQLYIPCQLNILKMRTFYVYLVDSSNGQISYTVNTFTFSNNLRANKFHTLFIIAFWTIGSTKRCDLSIGYVKNYMLHPICKSVRFINRMQHIY